jgi:hypothetical protein
MMQEQTILISSASGLTGTDSRTDYCQGVFVGEFRSYEPCATVTIQRAPLLHKVGCSLVVGRIRIPCGQSCRSDGAPLRWRRWPW